MHKKFLDKVKLQIKGKSTNLKVDLKSSLIKVLVVDMNRMMQFQKIISIINS